MRRTLIFSVTLLLFALAAFGGQPESRRFLPSNQNRNQSEAARETKEPLAGTGCVSVISKLQNLKAGMMKIKTCCGGISLKADVQLQNGKKTIKDWYVFDSNNEVLEAKKGWVDRGGNNHDYVVRSANGKACFIVEKKGN